jgi:hypothetical protein
MPPLPAGDAGGDPSTTVADVTKVIPDPKAGS